MVGQHRRVLIVDDSLQDRELYRRYLSRNNEYSYTILEASLGQQGLELWQQQQPDLLLLNYCLPDLNGLEFLAQLRSLVQQPYLPVIVVTEQGSEGIAIQVIEAGAQDYLVKEQLSAETFRIAINRTLTHVELWQQLHQSEAALRDREERLRSALVASRMGTWDWNGWDEQLERRKVLSIKMRTTGEGTPACDRG